jgi:hypothetical protein
MSRWSATNEPPDLPGSVTCASGPDLGSGPNNNSIASTTRSCGMVRGGLGADSLIMDSASSPCLVKFLEARATGHHDPGCPRLSAKGQRVALVCYSHGLASHLERGTANWSPRQQPAYVGEFHELGKLWGAPEGPDEALRSEQTVRFWEHDCLRAAPSSGCSRIGLRAAGRSARCGLVSAVHNR